MTKKKKKVVRTVFRNAKGRFCSEANAVTQQIGKRKPKKIYRPQVEEESKRRKYRGAPDLSSQIAKTSDAETIANLRAQLEEAGKVIENLTAKEKLIERSKHFVPIEESGMMSVKFKGTIRTFFSEARLFPKLADGWYDEIEQYTKDTAEWHAKIREIADRTGISIREIYTLGFSP
jgi:hypothetical protein